MQTAINRAGSVLVGTYARLALDLDIEQHTPFPHGGKIIAANHPATTDPFYLLSLFREPVYILITEIAFGSPVLGPILRASGHIEVSTTQGRPAFEEARRRLLGGQTVAIFPEGQLSPETGGLAHPHTGAIRLALEARVPVIPVGIYLDRERVHTVQTTCGQFTDTARWYPSGPYAMTVGEPLAFSGDVEDRAQVRDLTAHLMARIGHLALESACRLEARRAVAPLAAAETHAFVGARAY